jgi:hypothetical protein
MNTKTNNRWLRLAVYGFSLAAGLCTTGCQMSIGGQTLPSPWYLTDDVQYYAPSNEFKLPKEAAAMKAYKAEQELQRVRMGK